MLTRRAAVQTAVAALALSAVPVGAASAAERRRENGPVRLRLPAPTGPYAVGTVSWRLVDDSRPDPWVDTQPYRELMVSVRYPAARDAEAYPRAPQMLPGEAAGFDALNNLTDVPSGKVDWAATRTHAHEGAPVDRSGGPCPVVLYSPGAGDPRSLGSTLADDLASRGYVVVMVDHTYDATAVQFPGGRVETTCLVEEFGKAYPDEAKISALLKKTVDVRVADTRFVLDELSREALAPHGLRDAMDLDRIGMFGQSGGGFTALQAMHDDPRINAGADFDGLLGYVQNDSDAANPASVATDGLDRPFLLIGSDGNDLSTVPSWALLSRNSTGWHCGLSLRGAAHATYTDAEVMIPQIARQLSLPRETVVKNIGTITPARALAADRAYLAAFFDRWLRSRDDHGLLDGPSARYPEVRFFS
ncbi:alpha/beta hydrolase family protein [Actinacidiphila soli]|uniref:alpha/beta hydrolase family protein n=1 Tax=Actinacidiphila soli TaxID=2487275 RepID=UPI000FCA8403|nr:hydrolase [Actinacidiphila soli]